MFARAVSVVGMVAWLASSAAAADPPNVTAGAADSRTAGTARCRVEKPAQWTTGGVSWLGACNRGFANGHGVLINKDDAGTIERFYGQVERGRLRSGVLQSEAGLAVGTWTNGVLDAPMADDVAQRNKLIAATETASKAASFVSHLMAKKADEKSRLFYAKQAQLLKEQMD